MIPKVDTFEGDISYEIKRKEASLTEISAASNNVGNNDDIILPKKPQVFFIVLISFFVFCVIGLATLAYFYFNDAILSPTVQNTAITESAVPKNKADITTLSPTLSNEIGRFITGIEKKDQGYIITINQYSPVFAYMTRNENDYIQELSLLFGGDVAVKQNLPQISTTTLQATTTVVTKTATSTTSTSTIVVPRKATSTLSTQPTPKVIVVSSEQQPSTTTAITLPQETEAPRFTDITISNQNMRVWTFRNQMVVYAFVGTNTILISNTKEGILNLRSAILH